MVLSAGHSPLRVQATKSVLDYRGNLLWGTIKRTEIEAQEAHDSHNPDPIGEGLGEVVLPIEITLTKPE